MKYFIPIKIKAPLIISVLILALSIQVPVSAGNQGTSKTRETDDSISEIPEKLFHRNPKQHKSSFALSPDTVFYKLKQKQKITLVDVRSPEDFARLHVPGSLNIPLYAVKTKFFLKSFIIVLINEGFQYSLLESECQQLTDLGFKVFILDGGLPAWKRKANPLAGDLFALEEMQMVSPQIFFQEKDSENILVIDISPVQMEISRQLMPYLKHLPVAADPGEWARKLGRIIKRHKNQPFLSILVFNGSGDGYARTNKILADLGINTFYLQDGVGGYKRYLEDLMRSWSPQAGRIKTNRKCRTCNEEMEELIP